MKMKIMNITLSKYKSTEAICRFLNPFSEPGRPSSIKSRILFILGVKKYVLIRKLIAIAIPNIIPETKSPNEKNKNINVYFTILTSRTKSLCCPEILLEFSVVLKRVQMRCWVCCALKVCLAVF